MNSNFEKKYKKYKTKYLELKNQHGSGPKEVADMVNLILSHSDIGRLGRLKPVATPHSGQEPRTFINMWEQLTEAEKEEVKIRIYDEKQIILGIVITPFQELGYKRVANIIVFYSEDHLSRLAEACGKTLGEILDIIIWYDSTALPINMDIIKIAFGDEYTYGHLPMGQLSEDGNMIKTLYLSLE